MIYLSPQYDRSDIEIFTTFGVEIDGFFLPHFLVVRLMIFLTTFLVVRLIIYYHISPW